MDLFPTSSDLPAAETNAAVPVFFADNGAVLIAPREWERCRVWLPGLTMDAEARIPGGSLEVVTRRIGGQARVVVEWPRSGPGHYPLEIRETGGIVQIPVRIGPRKISEQAFAAMLDDLAFRLPGRIALALQRVGGLSGVTLLDPDESNIAHELHRLRRAVLGSPGRPGLLTVLQTLAADPHRAPREEVAWQTTWRARRPHPARFDQAITRPGNLDETGAPRQVLDRRVAIRADTYENRFLRAWVALVTLRLEELIRLVRDSTGSNVQADAAAMQTSLLTRRRQAVFLDDAAPTNQPLPRITMVLRKLPPYRAALEGYLEFNRALAARWNAPELDAPLENLPFLYQRWGTLVVLAALLETAPEFGFHLKREQITRRIANSLLVEVLPNGETLVELQRESGARVSFISERTFGGSGSYRSASFAQRPDVTILIEPATGPARMLLFDPKYKLSGIGEASEANDEPAPDTDMHGAGPVKHDIDKMHAYRDAIRDRDGARVVAFAAILYPGPNEVYGPGLAAFRATPGETDDLMREIAATIRAWLQTATADEISTRVSGVPGA